MRTALSFTITKSPVGELVLGASEFGCCLVEFLDQAGLAEIKTRTERRFQFDLVENRTSLLNDLEEQLRGYFTGMLRSFSIPLDLRGTEFERAVWQQLFEIPYGQTSTYGDIAGELGRPQAFRAVGTANGRNPLAILVPCHRVIGKGGDLCGYGGGIWRKAFLLELERKHASESGGAGLRPFK